MLEDIEYEYKIGDIIFNTWKQAFYVIVDYEYRSVLKYYTIKDLHTEKITINKWLHSKRLIWNGGNFNGYEKEYIISSHSQALSKYRKDKIKNLLN